MPNEVRIQLTHLSLKWEPVIRQFVKTGQGEIINQEHISTGKELLVRFSDKEAFEEFITNIRDIHVDYSIPG